MSVNWVMLDRTAAGFSLLPDEHKLWESPPRTSLSLQSLHQYPGQQPYSVASSSGRVILTNRRIVYLPNPMTHDFQSFNGPLLSLHDSRVTTPWLGPNAWLALVQPVPGGGIPANQMGVELKLTFRDGGAYEFHTRFVAIRERLQQAVEVARESRQATGSGTAPREAGVNLENVHLDQLPAYEEAAPDGLDRVAPAPAQVSVPTATQTASQTATSQAADSRQDARATPAEPPPGYEEVQRSCVAERLERELLSQ